MASFQRSLCQRSAYSPVDVRVVISDLVVSLPASLFIDLGHFVGWTWISQAKSTT